MEKVVFSRTVYSLIYPDTEKVLTKLWKKNPLEMYRNAHTGVQENVHLEFKDVWLDWTKDVVVWNQGLTNFYPTAGSSEAIRESIAQYSHHLGQRMHVFEGDYEGYSSFAAAYGIKVVKHSRNNFNTLMGINPGERFYLSQPSSIDGNVWDKFDEFVKFLEFFAPQTDLMLDLCYVGSISKEYKIDVSSKLVHTVFFSLSKVFGVYYHRIGGVFSKREMPGLIGNKWFKNIFSLTLGMELMRKYSIRQIPMKYEKERKKVIRALNKEQGFELVSADVFMLANSNSDKLKDYRRAGETTARICLTPMLDKELREKS